MRLRKKLACAVASVLLSATGTGVLAAYPDKPVTIVVPYAPGGATDSTTRILAQALQARAGKSFIVDNAPGGGTTIGAAKVTRAPADGYTFLFGGLSANVLAPQLYSEVISFDPETAFEPVAQVASQPLILVVNSESPYKSLDDLLTAARAKPGQINFGSPGAGSAPHLISELFLMEAGIEAQHIPFRGAAPSLTALIGGEIDIFMDTPTAPMPHVEGGKLRALGVTSKEPVAELNGIPTIHEQGVKDFEAYTWFALYAPTGTPPDILDQVNAWVNEALNDEQVRQQMARVYLYPAPGTRDDLDQYTRQERSRWTQIIKTKNLQSE